MPHLFTANTEADNVDVHGNRESRKSNITLGGDEIGRGDHMVVPICPGSQRGESAPQSASPLSSALAYDLPEPPPGLLSIRNAATRTRQQSKLVISTAPRTVISSSLSHSHPLTNPNLPSPDGHIKGRNHLHDTSVLLHPGPSRHPSTEAVDFLRKRLLARLEETAPSSDTVLSEHRSRKRAQLDSHSPVVELSDEGNRLFVTTDISVEPAPKNATATAQQLPAQAVNPSAVKEQALKARLIRRRIAVGAAAKEL